MGGGVLVETQNVFLLNVTIVFLNLVSIDNIMVDHWIVRFLLFFLFFLKLYSLIFLDVWAV